MTFKELALQEEVTTMGASFLQSENDKNFLQSLLYDQSPVMKLWFAIMLMNLALFLFVH